jgi:hypothetical protein
MGVSRGVDAIDLLGAIDTLRPRPRIAIAPIA